MPVFRKSTLLGIGASIDNVMQGSQFEILPSMAAGVPVAGWEIRMANVSTVDSVFADVLSGDTVLAENSELSDANRWPVDPDDFDLFDIAGPSERMKIRLRNGNAAAATVKTVVQIMPRF